MVVVRNRQRTVKIDMPQVKNTIKHILMLLDYADFDITVMFVSDKSMQEFNRQFRKIDKPTDILSFQAHDAIQPGKRIVVAHDDEKNLGDLILAPAYIQKDALQMNQSFDNRVRILLVHGICHLLGYDHETDADYKVMHKKEQWLLKNLGIVR
jgi:probable rRNA maturation factor